MATLNLVYYRFLRSVQRIASEVGENQVEKTFREQADTLQEAIDGTFFAP
jgi:hypothetical protein